jgi:hypothetical protein
VWSSFQIQSYFDSNLGARLADLNLDSNQFADVADTFSPDNDREESTLTQNNPREL